MTQSDKKEEILSILQELQEDKPELDLSVLSQDKKEVNENLDDGLTEFTKQLFASFYEDELDELDSLSFNNPFYPPFYPATPAKENKMPKMIVTANIDEDTGMITVMEEEAYTELMEATRNIDRMRAQSENIMRPIEDEKPMLKNYIDELNDQLAELDEMSFNFGLQEIPFSLGSEDPSKKRTKSPESNIQEARQPGQGLIEEKTPSPPIMQAMPKEKRQEARQPGQGLIEDLGQWISDNLTPTKRFKTLNGKYKFAYYPKEEIDAISDMGVLDYLKDDANTFKGLSQSHTKETLFYIQAQINSVLNRQESLLKNRGRGRPVKGKQSTDIQSAREKRLTDTFDDMPEPDKREFYDTIKKVDMNVVKMLKEYASEEAFENSYIPFPDDWEETEFYSNIVDMYYFNSDIDDILERNDINKNILSSWIDLHIERKNYLSEVNRLISRDERIRKGDKKLMDRSASKIQAGVRGFLTRKKLANNPPEKSSVVKQKEQGAADKYTNAIKLGLPNREILEDYLNTPSGTAKQIIKDMQKYFDSAKIAKKGQDSILKKLNKALTDIREQKEKELYDVEFNRKDFNTWRDMLLKQPYAASGRDAKIYDLKKQYKKADEPKQAQILEKYAQLFNQQKVNKLLTNYNIE